MFRPSIGQFGIGWITAAGEPKLTPLPDQHLVPRHEGNPLASASLDTASGSTWDGEWVFTEALTNCSVAITNSAGATVRTLPCNATYAAMGEAMVSWNGTDTTGTTVPGGLYTWTVNAGDADGAAVNTDGTAGISGTIAVHNSAGPSGYHALTPARVLDTRPGQQTVDGLYAGVGAVGPAATVTVPVTGRAGIPATGVAAVAVNITGISPTTATYVTAYPAGAATPAASTLNLAAGQAYANGSIVKVGTGGAITLYNAVGTTDLAVDVLGYYPTDGTYVALTPARLTDTRPGATTTDGGAAATGAIPAGDLTSHPHRRTRRHPHHRSRRRRRQPHRYRPHHVDLPHRLPQRRQRPQHLHHQPAAQRRDPQSRRRQTRPRRHHQHLQRRRHHPHPRRHPRLHPMSAPGEPPPARPGPARHTCWHDE